MGCRRAGGEEHQACFVDDDAHGKVAARQLPEAPPLAPLLDGAHHLRLAPAQRTTLVRAALSLGNQRASVVGASAHGVQADVGRLRNLPELVASLGAPANGLTVRHLVGSTDCADVLRTDGYFSEGLVLEPVGK